MTLDVIINIRNKEKTIESIYNKLEEELKDIKHNLIFIDNASTDKTLQILKNIYNKNDLCVKIISLSKKFDKDTCIYTGILHSIHDLICIYDTDTTNQVSYITKMYDYIKKHNEYDQVCLESNYKETRFIQKNKLEYFNKLYNLEYDYNKSYFRMFKRNIINAIIEYTKLYPFSLYTFNEIGFNTYYMKTDNKKIDKINYKKLICYSNNKSILYKITNLILLFILIICFTLSIFNVIDISNNTIILLIILTNMLNIYLCSNLVKPNKITYYLIKEKINFEEKVL